MNKTIWSVLMACSLVGISACTPPTPGASNIKMLPSAKTLSAEDMRTLKIMVPAPVKCSDLKHEIVNTVAGCETYGSYIDGDTAYKYSKPQVSDKDMNSTAPVRCLDLTPVAMRNFSICLPVVVVLESKVAVVPARQPEPAPTVESTGVTAGNTSTYASRSADSSYTEANSGDVHTYAGSNTLPDGTKVYETNTLRRTIDPDGTIHDEVKQ